ncbi:helix-turn-helix domain-containing protein [Streptomyces sp. AA0539]|uniref:helix-turn-helix domain-containing protein n=1 Tax=Streptomyces sp. AA0539 TaxID=1210045 RepID=UPI003FD4A5F3
MGRREAPITTEKRALRELAEWLREQRNLGGRRSYRELATFAGCHATTLQRAASGDKVPRRETVRGYARACGASEEEAERLWRAARLEESRAAAERGRQVAPSAQFVRDLADLSAALVDMYEKAGSPSLRHMEELAGGYGLLPRSTAHRIIKKDTVPRCREQLQAFLRACSVPEQEWHAWESAWNRARRLAKQDNETHQRARLQLNRRRAASRGLLELHDLPNATYILDVRNGTKRTISSIPASRWEGRTRGLEPDIWYEYYSTAPKAGSAA